MTGSPFNAWLSALIRRISKNPLIKLCAMLLAALGAAAGGVEALHKFFPDAPAEPPKINLHVDVSPPVPPKDEKPPCNDTHLWICIPPILRKDVTDFCTAPSQYVLDQAVLIWAPLRDAGSCLRTLLAEHASPDAATDSSIESYFGAGPPLISAIVAKQPSNALILLNAGANPNLRSAYKGFGDGPYGLTSLDAALDWNSPPEVIAAIKERGGVTSTNR
jgi:hypothetical protein